LGDIGSATAEGELLEEIWVIWRIPRLELRTGREVRAVERDQMPSIP
jgi:hypothetical protein